MIESITMSGRSETWSFFIGETLGVFTGLTNNCCPESGPCGSPPAC